MLTVSTPVDVLMGRVIMTSTRPCDTVIAIVEAAERFSYYGCSVVFTNFIQWPRPEGSRTGSSGTNGQSGALGMGQQASTGLTTFYQFW
jgi:proton-dependent oligopeptide transporter, POT family